MLPIVTANKLKGVKEVGTRGGLPPRPPVSFAQVHMFQSPSRDSYCLQSKNYLGCSSDAIFF